MQSKGQKEQKWDIGKNYLLETLTILHTINQIKF